MAHTTRLTLKRRTVSYLKGSLEAHSLKKKNMVTAKDVFLMVRRKKTSILLDAKENTTVHELKKMIAAITKVLPENQQLYKDDE
ncbi:hypothetical protein AVEN_11426-1, partial [Araneus ventricosus]